MPVKDRRKKVHAVVNLFLQASVPVGSRLAKGLAHVRAVLAAKVACEKKVSAFTDIQSQGIPVPGDL